MVKNVTFKLNQQLIERMKNEKRKKKLGANINAHCAPSEQNQVVQIFLYNKICNMDDCSSFVGQGAILHIMSSYWKKNNRMNPSFALFSFIHRSAMLLQSIQNRFKEMDQYHIHYNP